jgi:hypothetical protein
VMGVVTSGTATHSDEILKAQEGKAILHLPEIDDLERDFAG